MYNTPMNLKGESVLVTGGAKRIGKAIALAFAQRGCEVVLHYRNSQKEAEVVRAEIQAMGSVCRLVQADLSKAAKIDRMFEKEKAALSKVSILINSASFFYPTPLATVSRAFWNEFMETNLIGPFELARRVGLALKASGRPGLIVNITDRSSRRPYVDHIPYCASKAALENLTRTLALELAPNIRVNSVAPGAILFPDSYTEEEKRKIIDLVPLKRAGEAKDIAEACVFVAEADYINAITLTVDGGRSI